MLSIILLNYLKQSIHHQLIIEDLQVDYQQIKIAPHCMTLNITKANNIRMREMWVKVQIAWLRILTKLEKFLYLLDAEAKSEILLDAKVDKVNPKEVITVFLHKLIATRKELPLEKDWISK